MEILACPVCKGELELTVEAEEGDEIITWEAGLRPLCRDLPYRRRYT